ncbi:ergothioneine biosynthesis protein EgtB [Sphaerisporangium sp. TRM90804]|uniref:ergothioneine biosynthesis protein EgtB n=1 Tax=Sphaerisporangium sp. TRM90804 TaxID=3031113 RepID=UPI0024490725|nr:ergothioneine biosynthesis protein EgtB [Sphaerisporangium sp. TRM90804]MDH2426274.1 ergothioneine biosynthesis protein EgtB [Sphaerisporangium sp. TRM90804]
MTAGEARGAPDGGARAEGPHAPGTARAPRPRTTGYGAFARRPGVVHPEWDGLKEWIAAELELGRDRSLAYTDVDDETLVRQHSSLMSPLVWDLAHVGNYEELWVLREAGGIAPLRPEIDTLYDAFAHPRGRRPALPLLPPDEARRYISGVRGRVLDVLDAADLRDPHPLRSGGFVFGLVLQHEHQHDETMLATLQLSGEPGLVPDGPLPPGRPSGGREVLVPGGPFVAGTGTDPWAYDNERPAHRVDLPAYWIDRYPVTAGAYMEFVDDGGYADPRWWDPRGWRWRAEHRVMAPLFWTRDAGRWWRTRFGRAEPVPPSEPVQHVSWYEADAYARWAGRRLPSEAEWEKACGWDPRAERARRYPWGDDGPGAELANLGHRASRPAPVGAFPAGAAACGAEQMIGDVWEWTGSRFLPYPGFRSFPYREYSEVFFGGDYRVLRGGSWATHPTAARTTFRNWDHPIRRQIFAGFRCARDAARGEA